MESDLEGAMQFISKFEGVPLVTELCPITLLKLLSRILSKRLVRLLGTLLRSFQICSKQGGNICSSAVNLIFTVEGVARQLEGKGAIFSLDLFNAYYRVNLNYLQSVMEAMNNPVVFIYWVLILYDGAKYRLLLDFISKPINLTFSNRQGNPIAMILFLLYVDISLLCPDNVTTVVSLAAHQVRDVQATEVVGVVERCEGYVDNLQAVCRSFVDITNVDFLIRRFEPLSRAILNRSTKYKLMCLGEWRGGTQLPLALVESVESLRSLAFS